MPMASDPRCALCAVGAAVSALGEVHSVPMLHRMYGSTAAVGS
eukprot:SAG31_NODE_2744_length_5150_cov_4.544249_2_plen_43_part_00